MKTQNILSRFHLGNRHATDQRDSRQARPQQRATPERIDGGIALLLTTGYAFR